MKTLALLRHAKSDWDAGAPSDFDRPLSRRGIEAAAKMGEYMRRERGEFERALVSPARRCRETFNQVNAGYGGSLSPQFEERIYLASAGDLLDLVQAQDDAFSRLLLIGHNPGLTYLALELIREDATAVERERIAEKFPTGAYVQLSCEVDRWADLGKAACKLEVRRYPVEELA